MEANPLALAVQHRKPWPQPPNFGLIEGGTYVSTGPFQIAWFGHGTVSGPGVRIVLPYWVLAAAAFLLMAPWGWDRLRRRWRLRSGTCTSCGYDLRATPDRCPECGAVPAKAGR